MRRPGLRALLAGALLGSAGASSAPHVVVERLGDYRVRVEARAAPRDAVLEALASAAGFRLELGAGAATPAELSVDLADAALEDALAQVLAGLPYHLHYEAGGAGGEVALRRVTVGLLPPPPPGAAPREPPGERERSRTPPPGAPPGPDFASDEERRARVDALRGARAEGDREEAASLMRPEDDLAALLAYLGDPSPRVRARAAVSLGEADLGEHAFRAADGLLGALGDPDPAVVAAAVAGLESLYDVLPDPRIRGAAARLARHPDAGVRAAAAALLEWTGDEP